MLEAPELDAREIEIRGESVTIAELMDRARERPLTERGLRRVASRFASGSPAMLASAARWIGVVEDLAHAGLDNDEVRRALVSAVARMPPGWAPSPIALLEVFEDAPLDYVEALCDVLLGLDGKMESLGAVALAALARHQGAFDARFDALASFGVPWRALRQTVEPMPLERRDAVLARLFGAPSHDNGRRGQLQRVLPVLDLAGPATRAKVEAACEALAHDVRWAELLAAVRAGGGPPPVGGLTPTVQHALDYNLKQVEAEHRVKDAGAECRRLHGERVLAVDAAELSSVATWSAASDERREAIAALVASALGEAFRFVRVASFGGPPIALFEHQSGMSLSLVPGGTYVRGFSEREEALVREVAAAREGKVDNWDEEYQHLLEQVSVMRPLAEVAVGPLLACRAGDFVVDPTEVVRMIRGRAPFRLPSEAEWEYLSRGGKVGELTHLGHEVPDEAWLQAVLEAGLERTNAFGLAGFGVNPELCSDAWHPSYEGAPSDGAPREGEGPVVARGGAAMVYPWQACGEWQLLCNAVRGSAEDWDFGVALRPVVGLRVPQLQ
ncbi:MAG: hypothetical protein KF901_12595 [Myxococcales bacterium]|nr:hypothetical protein [Myxococcales bacterium]